MSYSIWIYNYLWNQCLSPLTLWVGIPLLWGVLEATLCDKTCQWLATGRWFSLRTPISSTNKTDHAPRYNWNSVECGVKQHYPNHSPKVKQISKKKGMNVNEHEKLHNFIIRYKLRWRNMAFITVLTFVHTCVHACSLYSDFLQNHRILNTKTLNQAF